MNVDALMQAAIIISAGDAIMTLGEHLFGSEQTFMEQAMNRLEEMGLAKQYTSFFDPARTWSAMELAQLGTAAKTDASFMQHCVIPRSVITHEDGRETELVNANRLLRSYAGCGGLITGSSQADGYSGIFYAARNGMEFICVVIGASSAADRFSIAEAIFNYGFANVKNVTLARAGEAVAEAVPVEEGETEHVDLVVKDTVVLLTETGNETYTQELNIPDPLTAPIFQNESVGTVRFYDEAGKLVAEAPLYPSLDIASYKLIDILKRVCASFLRQYGSLA